MNATRLVRIATALAIGGALTVWPAKAADAAPAYSEYVALGDSYSADATLTLITTQFVPEACLQSSRNYPKQIAAELNIPVFRDATCSQAKTVDMVGSQNLPVGPPNAPQFDRLTATTDLVTVGIGGNDIELMTAALRCGSPTAVGSPCKDRWTINGVDKISSNIANAETRIVGTLVGIRERSPNARILLVNFMAGVTPSVSCYPMIPIADGDALWLADKLVELNSMLASAASQTGVEVVDTYQGSLGHDACKPPGIRWVEGLIPFSADPPGLAVPLHPNQLGSDFQARTVLAALSGSD
jgi:hypothetical protein